MTFPPKMLSTSEPIHRQLLGVGTNANGFLSPKSP